MTILDFSFSSLRGMVSGKSDPLPQALPRERPAAAAMKTFQREHSWAADIPFFGYPEENKVGIFFEWCARSYLPDADRIGPMSFCATDKWIGEATMSLGKLVMTHGRPAVEAEVRRWFDLRLAEIQEKRRHEAEDGALYDRCLTVLRSYPAQSAAIAFGHLVGHELSKIQVQEDPHYHEIRDLRAESGLMLSPLSKTASLRHTARVCAEYCEPVEDYLMNIVSSNWRHLAVAEDATHLLNDLYARMFPRMPTPWWVEGYDTLITHFGPDITPRKLIDVLAERASPE